MNPFSDKYRTLSNHRLLEIIQNRQAYRDDAVKAAEDEIKRREMSEQDISEARMILEINDHLKQRQSTRWKTLVISMNQWTQSRLSHFNPFLPSISFTERAIRALTILFLFLAIYKWLAHGSLALLILTNNQSSWDIATVFFFLELTLPLLAVILFWRRYKAGWLMMNILLTYYITATVLLIYNNLTMEPMESMALQILMTPFSTETLVLAVAFYLGCGWTLNHPSIVKCYKGTKELMVTSVVFTALVILFLMTL